MTEQRAAYEAATIEAMHAQAAPVAPEPPDMEYTPITAPLPRLVRRDETGPPRRIAGLPAELVRPPVAAVVAALEHDLAVLSGRAGLGPDRLDAVAGRGPAGQFDPRRCADFPGRRRHRAWRRAPPPSLTD